jgi:hypothetical protein
MIDEVRVEMIRNETAGLNRDTVIEFAWESLDKTTKYHSRKSNRQPSAYISRAGPLGQLAKTLCSIEKLWINISNCCYVPCC